MVDSIDPKSAAFLRAVQYYAGEADISQIRAVSGLSRNEANYRFDKLSDLNLIDITRDGDASNAKKIAHLTGKARREIERGLVDTASLVISDDPDPRAGEVSRERFVDLENKVGRLAEAQRATVNAASSERVAELEEYIIEWTETAETYLMAVERICEDHDIDFKLYLSEAQTQVETPCRYNE